MFLEPTADIELVEVPGGCFMMGSANKDKNHQKDEGPMHEVCVDGFWMGKYEVTKKQWRKIMGRNASGRKNGDDYPVTEVSWADTQLFLDKLNEQSYAKFRLPTEAEWEYACRANSSGSYCGGDVLNAVAWYRQNGGGSIHPVGTTRRPNAFGLYDMSGNAWEWCEDWYEANYYMTKAQDNPHGPATGKYRVLRGGGYFNSPERCRSTVRMYNTPAVRPDSIGFRIVLPLKESTVDPLASDKGF